MAAPPDSFPTCDVCGRTVLKGEEVHEYLTSQGERLDVCALYRSRAEASGWIPIALAHTIAQEPTGRSRRGQAFRNRIGRVTARARAASRAGREVARQAGRGRGGADEEAAAGDGDGAPTPREPRSAAPQEPAGPAAPSAPRPRRGPEAIMRRAVEHFNASEERHTVAGLIRSLGEPRAAVRADPIRQLALVTVAWELSWYQWEVKADGAGDLVREVAKGKEVSELPEEAREWNAVVTEDGAMRLRSARRAPTAPPA